MELKSLQLYNFRNFKRLALPLSPGTNLLFGRNGQGKTNFLEALNLVVTGRSFRTKQMRDLYGPSGDHFCIEVHFEKGGIDQKLSMTFEKGERRLVYNRTPYKTLSGLLGLLQGVLIVPDDQGIVKGGPALRRQLLDLYLSKVDPLYVHHLKRYARSLRQRNHLLKAGADEGIQVFELELAKSGSFIAAKRQIAVERLDHISAIVYADLARSQDVLEPMSLVYEPESKDISFEGYLEKYRAMRGREKRIGTTVVGPHRDDMMVSIGGSDARHFASEGQIKTAALALRLAEWEAIYKEAGDKPLLLIDDFAAHLDLKRQGHLLEKIESMGQVFLTTTERASADLKCQHYEVVKGEITPQVQSVQTALAGSTSFH